MIEILAWKLVKIVCRLQNADPVYDMAMRVLKAKARPFDYVWLWYFTLVQLDLSAVASVNSRKRYLAYPQCVRCAWQEGWW